MTRLQNKNVFKKMVTATVVCAVLGWGGMGMAQETARPDGKDCPRKAESKNRSGKTGFHGSHGKDKRGPDGRFGKLQNLSGAQREKLQTARKQFLENTLELRRQIREKKLLLEAELVKSEPNVEAAKAIVNELSTLKAEMARKRLEKRLQMKKIAPELDFRFDRHGHRGHHGHKTGHKRGGCPYQK